MITHCNETISGLDTIRAFGKETWFMSEMINRIDNHTKVFLIISSSNRWLGIALVSTLYSKLETLCRTYLHTFNLVYNIWA